MHESISVSTTSESSIERLVSIYNILDLSLVRYTKAMKCHWYSENSISPDLVPCLRCHVVLSSYSIATIYSYPLTTLTCRCTIVHTKHISSHWVTQFYTNYMRQKNTFRIHEQVTQGTEHYTVL
jgi:hypothetical protein